MRHAYIIIDVVGGGIVSVHTNGTRAWAKVRKMASEKGIDTVDVKGHWSVSKWPMDAPPEVRSSELNLALKSVFSGFIGNKSDAELHEFLRKDGK